MLVQGHHRQAIEPQSDSRTALILDQTLLPHHIEWRTLSTESDTAQAITTMQVRGAPLIGVTAAYGLYFATRDDPSDSGIHAAYDRLHSTRPTAINLRWALDRVRAHILPFTTTERPQAAWAEALRITAEDIQTNVAIGQHGAQLLHQLASTRAGAQASPSPTLNILTHCNAGWLATADWGTALSPIYHAHAAGMAIHVWVSETRPRNQGASLTAWELAQQGIPHTLIVDNAAGHLMQHGLVDACIVGADRVTATGDVANKIGTYLKALAAREHRIPFYIAMPTSTIDWSISDGVKDIPIEQRSPREVTHLSGLNASNERQEIRLTPGETQARNDAFDVTPAKLITAYITEQGIRHKL
jgi:methylthioribose-1-phosphate isomerase